MPRAFTMRWVFLSVLVCICFAASSRDYRAGSLARQEIQAVYSADPQDSWNRIFYLLFTRKVETRLTEDFGVEGPFVPTALMGDPSLPVTTRTFERIESGDRAIDPLYPNFLSSKGSDPILTEPGFSELRQALHEACAETRQRPALTRALMQSDIWAAYDIVARSRTTDSAQGDHARALLPLFRQFIAKLALSPEEIASLRRNYENAQQTLDLPRVFDTSSSWIEVEGVPHRSHDEMGNNRHAARIFLKPRQNPQIFLREVNQRIRKRKDPLPDGIKSLSGAVLLTEILLIDRSGRVVPSPLISDVQLRRVIRDSAGHFVRSEVEEYELSRQSILADTGSGGFVRRRSDEPSYLPASGNDFTFASPMISEREPKPPILGTLKQRCETCHFESTVFTFQTIMFPGRPTPTLGQLNPAEDRRGAFVAKEKMKSRDFQSLK